MDGLCCRIELTIYFIDFSFHLQVFPDEYNFFPPFPFVPFQK